MKWIKTSEQLPEKSQNVLFLVKWSKDHFEERYSGVYVESCGDKYFTTAGGSGRGVEIVTHWMPYPDLPEEKL